MDGREGGREGGTAEGWNEGREAMSATLPSSTNVGVGVLGTALGEGEACQILSKLCQAGRHSYRFPRMPVLG